MRIHALAMQCANRTSQSMVLLFNGREYGGEPTRHVQFNSSINSVERLQRNKAHWFRDRCVYKLYI